MSMARNDLENKLHIFHQARGKSQALDTVVAKYRDEEQRQDKRRDQILSDEQAQRISMKENDIERS